MSKCKITIKRKVGDVETEVNVDNYEELKKYLGILTAENAPFEIIDNTSTQSVDTQTTTEGTSGGQPPLTSQGDSSTEISSIPADKARQYWNERYEGKPFPNIGDNLRDFINANNILPSVFFNQTLFTNEMNRLNDNYELTETSKRFNDHRTFMRKPSRGGKPSLIDTIYDLIHESYKEGDSPLVDKDNLMDFIFQLANLGIKYDSSEGDYETEDLAELQKRYDKYKDSIKVENDDNGLNIAYAMLESMMPENQSLTERDKGAIKNLRNLLVRTYKTQIEELANASDETVQSLLTDDQKNVTGDKLKYRLVLYRFGDLIDLVENHYDIKKGWVTYNTPGGAEVYLTQNLNRNIQVFSLSFSHNLNFTKNMTAKERNKAINSFHRINDSINELFTEDPNGNVALIGEDSHVALQQLAEQIEELLNTASNVYVDADPDWIMELNQADNAKAMLDIVRNNQAYQQLLNTTVPLANDVSDTISQFSFPHGDANLSPRRKYDLITSLDYLALRFMRNRTEVEQFDNKVGAELYTYVREELERAFEYDNRDLAKMLFDKSKEASANWAELLRFHARRMRMFNMKINGSKFDSALNQRDTAFNREAFTFDTKDTMPPIVKLFMSAGIIETAEKDLYGEDYAPMYNSIGLPVRADFNQVYNFVANNLAGLSPESQLQRINTLLDNFNAAKERDENFIDPYSDTLRAIKDIYENTLNNTSPTAIDEMFNKTRFLAKLQTTFSKQKPRFYIVNFDGRNGEFRAADQNMKKLRSKLKRVMIKAYDSKLEVNTSIGAKVMLKSDLIAIANELTDIKNSIERETDEVKIIEAYDKLGQALSKLGYESDDWLRTFRIMQESEDLPHNNLKSLTLDLASHVADSVKIFAEMNTTKSWVGNNLTHYVTGNYVGVFLNDYMKREMLDMIANAGSQLKITGYDYANERTKLNQANAMNKILKAMLDAMQVTTTRIVNNQAVNVNSDVIYGISNNHAITRVTSEMNSRDYTKSPQEIKNELRRKIQFYDTSWGNNSFIMNKLSNSASTTVQTGYLNGLTSTTGVNEFGKLAPIERFSAMFNETLNGTMFFFRAADRSVEFVTRVTVAGKPWDILSELKPDSSSRESDLKEAAKIVYKKYYEDEIVTRIRFKKGLDNAEHHLNYKKQGGNPRIFGKAFFENSKALYNADRTQVFNEIEKLIQNLVDDAELSPSDIRSRVRDLIESVTDLDDAIERYLENRVVELYDFAESIGFSVPLNKFEETNVDINEFGYEELIHNTKLVHMGMDAKYRDNPQLAFMRFAVLSEINYIEQSKLFAGDPAFYKDQNDWFKRMKVTTGSGKDTIATPQFNEMLNQSQTLVVEELTTVKIDGVESKQWNPIINLQGESAVELINNMRSGSIIDSASMLEFDPKKHRVRLGPGFRYDYAKNNISHGPTFEAMILDDAEIKAAFLGDQVWKNFKQIDKVVRTEDGTYQFMIGDNAIPDTAIGEFTKFLADDIYNSHPVNQDPKVLASKLVPFIKAYSEMEEADGESYSTIHMYRDMLIRNEGVWNDEQESAYVKMITGQKLTKRDKALFRKLKTLGSGNLDKETISGHGNEVSSGEGIVSPVIYKHSVMPIHPALVGEGTVLAKLHEFMENNGISLAVYGSANKAGQISSNGRTALYDDNGRFNYEGININGKRVNTQSSRFSSFNIQLDMKPVFKDKTTVGSQWRKLVLSNMFRGGVPIDYAKDNPNATLADWNSFSESEKKHVSEVYKVANRYLNTQASFYESHLLKLSKEIDLQITEGENASYVIGNMEKLTEILTDMAIQREFSNNDIASIQELANDQENVFIEHLVNSDKIENVLFAIVNNRVIKEKRGGTMAPQLAVTGFEFTKDQFRIQTPGESGVFKANSDALRFYRKGHDGKTLPAEIMFRIPDNPEFAQWFQTHFKSDLDALNQHLDKLLRKKALEEEQGIRIPDYTDLDYDLLDIIKVIGFRIPTQGMNSGDMFRIRRFLPINSADTIVVPSEIVGKTGSDFDIDKMTMYLKNYKFKDGRLQVDTVDYDFESDPAYVQHMYREYVAKLKTKEDLELDKSLETQLTEEIEGLKSQIKVDNASVKQLTQSSSKLFTGVKTQKQLLENNVREAVREMDSIQAGLYVKNIVHNISGNLSDKLPNGVDVGEDAIMILEMFKKDGYDIEDAYVKVLDDMRVREDTTDNEIDNIIDIIQNYVDASREFHEFRTKDYTETHEKIKELKKQKIALMSNKDANKETIDALTKQIEDFRAEMRNAEIDAKIKLINEGKLDGYTFNYFAKQTFEAMHSDKAKENSMIDLQFEILSMARNRRQLMSPITDSFITDKKIGALWDIRFIESKSPEAKLYMDDKKAAYRRIMLKSSGTDQDKMAEYTKEINESYEKYKKLYVDRITGDKTTKWNEVFKAETNIMKALYFLSGKDGVGQAAVQVTNHILAQMAGLSGTASSTDWGWYFEHNRTSDGAVDFSQHMSKDGNYISESLSALVNAYVDVAKDPFIFDLNAGSDNANMQFMLLRAGTPAKTVYRMLNQPVIKKFQKFKNIYGSNMWASYKTFNSDGRRTSDTDLQVMALQEMANELGINVSIEAEFDPEASAFVVKINGEPVLQTSSAMREVFKQLNSEIEKMAINGGGGSLSKGLRNLLMINFDNQSDPNKEYVKEGIEIRKSLFTDTKLEDMIMMDKESDNTSNGVKVMKELALMLDSYLGMQVQTSTFQKLIKAVSADTAGMAKTQGSNYMFMANRNAMLSATSFKNADKMLNNTIVGTPDKVVERFSKVYEQLMFFNAENRKGEANIGAKIGKAIRAKVIQMKKIKGLNARKVETLERRLKQNFIQAAVSSFVKGFENDVIFEEYLIPKDRGGTRLSQIIKELDTLAKNGVGIAFTNAIEYKPESGKYWPSYKAFANKKIFNPDYLGFDTINANYDISGPEVNEIQEALLAIKKHSAKGRKIYEDLFKIIVATQGFGNNSMINLFEPNDVIRVKSTALNKIQEFGKELDDLYVQRDPETGSSDAAVMSQISSEVENEVKYNSKLFSTKIYYQMIDKLLVDIVNSKDFMITEYDGTKEMHTNRGKKKGKVLKYIKTPNNSPVFKQITIDKERGTTALIRLAPMPVGGKVRTLSNGRTEEIITAGVMPGLDFIVIDEPNNPFGKTVAVDPESTSKMYNRLFGMTFRANEQDFDSLSEKKKKKEEYDEFDGYDEEFDGYGDDDFDGFTDEDFDAFSDDDFDIPEGYGDNDLMEGFDNDLESEEGRDFNQTDFEIFVEPHYVSNNPESDDATIIQARLTPIEGAGRSFLGADLTKVDAMRYVKAYSEKKRLDGEDDWKQLDHPIAQVKSKELLKNLKSEFRICD